MIGLAFFETYTVPTCTKQRQEWPKIVRLPDSTEWSFKSKTREYDSKSITEERICETVR